jgi:uncharacterized protein YaeQ
MALKATICKATIQVSDMDRGYYNALNLTIAQHPSETDERMMIRVLAYILHAAENLEFTKGLSADDEPEIWLKSLSNEIELWVELGLPDEKRIRKACNRSKEVYLYIYGGNTARTWWDKNEKKFDRFKNLHVINLSQEATKAIGALAQKNMNLQCTIQDGQIWLGDDDNNVMIEPKKLYGED